jgi:hypothetical protein
MTIEQKKRADEITGRISVVSNNLLILTKMIRESERINVRDNYGTWVEVSGRVQNIIFTIVEADYKDELQKLEAEFNAL